MTPPGPAALDPPSAPGLKTPITDSPFPRRWPRRTRRWPRRTRRWPRRTRRWPRRTLRYSPGALTRDLRPPGLHCVRIIRMPSHSSSENPKPYRYGCGNLHNLMCRLPQPYKICAHRPGMRSPERTTRPARTDLVSRGQSVPAGGDGLPPQAKLSPARWLETAPELRRADRPDSSCRRLRSEAGRWRCRRGGGGVGGAARRADERAALRARFHCLAERVGVQVLDQGRNHSVQPSSQRPAAVLLVTVMGSPGMDML
jgi:hypothetical protein